MAGTSPGTLSTLSVSISDPRMLFRLCLSVVLTSSPLLANQCCSAESPRLSPKRLKILIPRLKRFLRGVAPRCFTSREQSTSVNPDGDVTRVEMISPTSTDLRHLQLLRPGNGSFGLI